MSRLIDAVPPPSQPPKMEVLILGMPRTGTISIRLAFEILSYKPFHGRMMDTLTHLYPLWTEALSARYLHTVPVYTRPDYDKLFSGFNVSCNIPGTLVAEDLIRAYPEAKVILSTRDVDKWLGSMHKSVDKAVQWKSFDWVARWDTKVINPWWQYHKFTHSLRHLIAPNGERQAYLDHYARIKELVPEDRLLEFNPAEGWEPLCEFLGRPVPEMPFPCVNNTEQFLEGRKRRWWRSVGLMVVKTRWKSDEAVIDVHASWGRLPVSL
ncbi:hypothetical protein BO94DRAFT_609828 [Aspergillus sclerotioniger CBS 115572]|uniref:NAD dependent epimerase/dehydratase n=1 Tax=Aspergillus sclerotioniger CBS 115572 TaxID=1450535 RepID=A0A317X791_9EURO|nr:hypothetical protein BO94DRAFT_609828 [Aspergillus sclerotioniger CBS 115572]PWY94486.1 hypothetical protein BO94DRAFT_609828 [Aspergillus sclerotioniger CBS 115572]